MNAKRQILWHIDKFQPLELILLPNNSLTQVIKVFMYYSVSISEIIPFARR